MSDYFAGVVDRTLDPLTWVRFVVVMGLYLLTLYPVLGERPWGAPRWMDRIATRLFVRGRVAEADGFVLWGVTVVMGLVAAGSAGHAPWVETVLAVDVALVGMYGLRIYNHLGLTESRLGRAEAELESRKEPRREDEATPA